MTMRKPRSEQAAKMQKLRRAVERLRNLRGSSSLARPKRSTWFERLKTRLGLATPASSSEEE